MSPFLDLRNSRLRGNARSAWVLAFVFACGSIAVGCGEVNARKTFGSSDGGSAASTSRSTANQGIDAAPLQPGSAVFALPEVVVVGSSKVEAGEQQTDFLATTTYFKNDAGDLVRISILDSAGTMMSSTQPVDQSNKWLASGSIGSISDLGEGWSRASLDLPKTGEMSASAWIVAFSSSGGSPGLIEKMPQWVTAISDQIFLGGIGLAKDSGFTQYGSVAAGHRPSMVGPGVLNSYRSKEFGDVTIRTNVITNTELLPIDQIIDPVESSVKTWGDRRVVATLENTYQPANVFWIENGYVVILMAGVSDEPTLKRLVALISLPCGVSCP